MIDLAREGMTEDIRERFDALTDYERRALAAIVEAEGYSIEEALDIVESGDYEYYEETPTMVALAHEIAGEYLGIDSDTLAQIDPFLDYYKLADKLATEGYRDTSCGIVRACWR